MNLPDATRAPLPSAPGAAAPGEVSALDSGTVHRERMADLGELTAGIAHELNNPIGYIGSNLNTLRRYVEVLAGLVQQAGTLMAPEQLATWQQMLTDARWTTVRDDLVAVVDETRVGAEHLKNVVGDLKLLARTSVVPEHGCVDQCVLSALSVLTHQLKHRCQVERELDGHTGLLLVRPQIIQLAINLVHNAAQAVGPGGRIRIATRGGEALVTLTVEDDGPGVPPARWADIFRPYVTTKVNGTGLGLAIVARIARAHGGTVQVDASPTLGGARFTVTLRDWRGTENAAPEAV